ncbi:hypothetical protein Tco_1184486 [Tanacetum coccineum]
MNRRKKHFAKLRSGEIRRKPPTKAQKRNQMSIYLKNMVGYKHSQLKSKSYDEIQKLFDKEMKRVNTFVDINSEVVKGSETRTEESSKRAGDELESDKSKKQKIDEHVEAEKDDDPEEEEMKKHMEIVQDEEEIAIDAIPLATKPPMIVEYKIVKEGQKGFYHLIRADGSSKRYSSMIRMLQGIDREDLETLWKLVKEKHGINRPVDEYERVLWGDMKVITAISKDVNAASWIKAVTTAIAAASLSYSAAKFKFFYLLNSLLLLGVMKGNLRLEAWIKSVLDGLDDLQLIECGGMFKGNLKLKGRLKMFSHPDFEDEIAED